MSDDYWGFLREVGKGLSGRGRGGLAEALFTWFFFPLVVLAIIGAALGDLFYQLLHK